MWCFLLEHTEMKPTITHTMASSVCVCGCKYRKTKHPEAHLFVYQQFVLCGVICVDLVILHLGTGFGDRCVCVCVCVCVFVQVVSVNKEETQVSCVCVNQYV